MLFFTGYRLQDKAILPSPTPPLRKAAAHTGYFAPSL
jgi:hypothetical protein